MMAATNVYDFKGVLQLDEPMSKHTSWRVGGKVDQLYTPSDIDDLSEFLKNLPSAEPVMFIGLGSNLLVRDGGIRGTVISLKGCLSEITLLEKDVIRASAGVSCAKLSRFCHRNNLLGGEFFAGIPGLLGGALAMNAGAFGGETWSVIESVTTIDMQGNIYVRSPQDYEIAYRYVKRPKDEWFVGADIKLTLGDGEAAAKNIKALLEKRNQTQPTGLPSCGSVFKNPPGDFAARLIEACGLKGYKIGDAVVSEKHANFIINSGNASASDVEKLMELVQKTVEQKEGVKLQSEVKIVGEFADE